MRCCSTARRSCSARLSLGQRGQSGTDEAVEVLQGLAEGDRVLAGSLGAVRDGAAVRLTDAAASRRASAARCSAPLSTAMWFTRVAIGNPVMAVMVMLAFVVLGLFSYQRLKVDQFPDIDFPTVVVQIDYPGAAPEIVEQEVTRKVEEAVNTIAGVNQLFSRSYEGSSVVIVQFNLDMDGRKAADDVREKVAADPPAAARRGQGRACLALRPGQPADLHAGIDLARRHARARRS